MIGLILRGKQIYDKFSKDEMTVYAAQASFFTIIAAFPFIMLLMAMIQLIPTITKSNLLQVITSLVPDRKSTRLNSSHECISRMPSSA